MRTLQAALDYYNDFWKDSEDLLGFMVDALLPFLPYEEASHYVTFKAETSADKWNESVLPLTEENVLAQMREYMEFAWEKAQDHRGISAGRSVQKMQVWLMLLGDDDLLRYARDDEHYAMYGAPVLAKICEKYGFPIPDDPMLKNMINGLPCCDDCGMGCT